MDVDLVHEEMSIQDSVEDFSDTHSQCSTVSQEPEASKGHLPISSITHSHKAVFKDAHRDRGTCTCMYTHTVYCTCTWLCVIQPYSVHVHVWLPQKINYCDPICEMGLMTQIILSRKWEFFAVVDHPSENGIINSIDTPTFLLPTTKLWSMCMLPLTENLIEVHVHVHSDTFGAQYLSFSDW